MSTAVAIEGFEDITEVGEGGSSVVYSAYEPAFDRRVAIKVIQMLGDTSRDQFLRELRLTSRLADHPNVVTVFQSGWMDDGAAYFVMPFYPDGSLGDLLRSRKSLSADEVLRVGIKLAGALASAHAISLVHGDLKPENVLFNRYGEPILSDFGTARYVAGESLDQAAAYTPRYTAPEVLSTGVAQTPQSDIFSLGVTLAFAIGERLWQEDATDFRSIVASRQQPVSISDAVPTEISGVLRKALSLDPSSRLGAAEVGMALQDAQRALGTPVTEMYVLDELSESPQIDLTAADARSRTVFADPLNSSNHTVFRTFVTDPAVIGSHSSASSQAPPLAAPPPATAQPPPPPLSSTHVGGSDEPTSSTTPSAWERLRRLFGRAMRSVTLATRRLVGPARTRSVGPSDDSFTKVAASVSMSSLQADRPTGIDLLGNHPIVLGMARVLNDAGTSLPLTISVGGRWGSGKSSIMLQLERELSLSKGPKDRQWTSVWFDAWRFQSRDVLWAGVASAIYRQGLDSHGSLLAKARFWTKLQIRRYGFLKFVIALSLCIATFGWVITSALRSLGGEETGLSALTGAALVALALAVSYFSTMRDPFQRSARVLSFLKGYEETLGLSDRAERDIDHIIDLLTPTENRALIVFLDDLDRCEPKVVRQALVAVSEIFGRRPGDRVAFVLGVDMDIVISIVESELDDVAKSLAKVNPERGGLLGAQFLEKVFQLHVNLESERRPPTERLLFGAVEDQDRAGRAREFLSVLRDFTIDGAADLTVARREHGLGTQEVVVEDLPALRSAVRERRSELLASDSEDVQAAERAVLKLLRLTPRAVKRFDNTYRLQLQVATNTPGSELEYHSEDLLALAKWTALRMFYPRLTTAIAAEIGLWEELEAHAAQTDTASFDALLKDLPTASGEVDKDFHLLVALGLPDASLRRLPTETFAGIV